MTERTERRNRGIELMTAERFEAVRSLYVVLPLGDGGLFWWNWLLWPESRWGDVMPRQVPNLSMRWRRPTYEEAVARQEAFEERDDWLRIHERDVTGGLRRWRERYGRPDMPRTGGVLVSSTPYQPTQTGATDE